MRNLTFYDDQIFHFFAIFLSRVEEGSSNNGTKNSGVKKKTCLVGDLFQECLPYIFHFKVF